MSDIDRVITLATQNAILYRALQDIEALLYTEERIAVTCTDDYQIVQRIIDKIIELKRSTMP